MNGSSDKQPSLADPSSISSSSSLFSSSSSSSLDAAGNCYTLEARLPLVTQKSDRLEKFHRLLTRLDHVYNHRKMSATTLPPSSSHYTDRYLFRSLSNDNHHGRGSSSNATRKTKLTNGTDATSTPPAQRKRYKFSSITADQNNNDVYKFPNGQGEQRSQSTDSTNRYYFPPDDAAQKSQQTFTYVRSGNALEQRSVTFIDGMPTMSDKISLPLAKSITPATITPDTPYLFSTIPEPPSVSREGKSLIQ